MELGKPGSHTEEAERVSDYGFQTHILPQYSVQSYLQASCIQAKGDPPSYGLKITAGFPPGPASSRKCAPSY